MLCCSKVKVWLFEQQVTCFQVAFKANTLHLYSPNRQLIFKSEMFSFVFFVCDIQQLLLLKQVMRSKYSRERN